MPSPARTVVLALAVLTLAGCGAAPQPALPALPTVDAGVEAAGFDVKIGDVRFSATLSGFAEHSPSAYMQFSGKPLIGARVTDSYLMYRLKGAYAGWKHVWLGRDGKLYLNGEEHFRRHPETGIALGEDFYAIGLYNRTDAAKRDGKVRFDLLPGVKLVRYYDNTLVKVDDHLEIQLDKLPAPTKQPPLLPVGEPAGRS